MNEKKLKILLAKPGLDGHDVGVKVLAHALVAEGFDVSYTGLRKTISEIVDKAVENSSDIIALSILSGTHVVLAGQMHDELSKRGLDLPWIVGGNIPDEDVGKIEKAGANKAFATGTQIHEVVDYFKQFIESSE